MVGRFRGDLGSMRHGDDLDPLREARQALPDGVRHRAADTRVDLVEHQGRGGTLVGEHDLKRQHEAGKLAAGCHFEERTGRVPGLVCAQNSTRSKPAPSRLSSSVRSPR